MQLAENRFRTKMAARSPTYGLWAGLPDATAAEILAGAGFDWLVIDGEHAPFDLPATLRYLQTLAAYDVAPIVRAVEGRPALLKQLLDIGAETLLVPMVESAAEAGALVRAVRYPPDGIRGVGTSLARAARWGGIPDYLAKANDQVCLLVQVESGAGLAALPEIVAVDGVDGVFIGPYDLSASLGFPGEAGNAQIVRAIVEALRCIAAGGKYAGVLCLDPDLTDTYREAGADFIGVGVDTNLLGTAARRLAGAQR